MSHLFTRFAGTLNVGVRACLGAMCCAALLFGAVPARAQSMQDPVYVFHTSLGDMRVQMFPDVAPKTVANFLAYVSSGAYNSSIFHRSVPGFVIQGGGFTADSNAKASTIPTRPPVVNEFHLSNTRGTIAMAKVGSDPNSATDQWFFNEGDNSANLDNQNGGFTVFGRITDTASLAVMDKIAAVPTYDQGSPFDQVPLQNYQSGSSVTAANLVFVSSITPAWAAVSTAAGPGGQSRVLWDRGDGAMTLWTLNSDGSAAAYSGVFGPYAGWTAQAVSVGPDNAAHILWTNADGRMTPWTLDANNQPTGSFPVFGPYAGWTATGISTGTDGSTHILWTNTDGRMTPWTLTPSNQLAGSFPVFGPFAGWTAKSISVGPDSKTHILWDNADGRMTPWTLDTTNQLTGNTPVFGPYAGWSAAGISVGPDGETHILWDNADGRMTPWILDTNNQLTGSFPVFGPDAGWTAVGISTGPDGSTHVLWDNADGRMTPWTLTPSNQLTGNFPIYGPY